MMRTFKRLPTVRLSAEDIIEEDDLIAIESVLEVRVQNEFIAAFLCSPGDEKELAIGYLLSTGIVQHPSDIERIRLSNNRCILTISQGARINKQRGFSQVRRIITTECSAPELLQELRTGFGVPQIQETMNITFDRLKMVRKLLNELQENRRKTGAFHGALLHHISKDEYVFAEDLGRHNAVDKAIGKASFRKLDMARSLMFSSGRLTADIVSKCAWARIPLLVSFAVATDAAIKFAQQANITLIGAYKRKNMRLYHQGAAKVIFN